MATKTVNPTKKQKRNQGRGNPKALIAAVNAYAVAHDFQLYIFKRDSPAQRTGKLGKAYRLAKKNPQQSYSAGVIASYTRYSQQTVTSGQRLTTGH